jgi:hypothetical protein
MVFGHIDDAEQIVAAASRMFRTGEVYREIVQFRDEHV